MMLYMPTALSVPLTKYELHFRLSRHESLLDTHDQNAAIATCAL